MQRPRRTLTERWRTRRRLGRGAAIEGVFWLLLLAFVGSRMWPQVAAALGVGATATRAPELRLTSLSGEPISAASLRGKVVLVNFWATWCPPCRVEMPGFERLYEQKRDSGFAVIGVSTDAVGEAAVGAFLRAHGITYPVAMESGRVRADFGGVTTLPTSFLIDRSGRIRYRVTGIFAALALEHAVDRLLAERPGGGS